MRRLSIGVLLVLLAGFVIHLSWKRLEQSDRLTATIAPAARQGNRQEIVLGPGAQRVTPKTAVPAAFHAEAARREKMAKAETDFREIVSRNITLDYGPYFASRSLSPERRDLALKALCDQFSAPNAEEKKLYDELLQQILGEELFAQLQAYRDRLPVEKQVAAGIAAIKYSYPELNSSEEGEVRRALEAIPPVNGVAIAAVQQALITDEDVQRVFASYEKLFDDAFAGAAVTSATRAALREWYLKQQISVQMNVLRTQQLILSGKGRG